MPISSTKREEPECSAKCRSKKDAAKVISVISRSGDAESLTYLSMAGLCGNLGRNADSSGRTALHLAASVGKPLVLEWLLRFKGAHINAKDAESGYSALHRAIFQGQIHVAKLLISNFNANIAIQDNEGLTPLDHVSKDRGYLRKSAGAQKWAFKKPEFGSMYDSMKSFVQEPISQVVSSISSASDCDVYVWGTNDNFVLGLGHEAERSAPDIIEFFRKEKVKCRDVHLSKFHSAFLTSDGGVYTCGHGRGGRLGHGSEESQLHPKLSKGFQVRINTL